MRKIILGCILLLPLAAMARPSCEHSAPQDLTLDLGGIDTVVFEVGPHDLRLDAAPNAKAALHGRACASSADLLKSLSLTQHRDGNMLLVSMQRKEISGISLFRSRYAYLELKGSLPDNVAVQVKVGSGDAEVSGVASIVATVGSGDLEARHIAGALTASVGSGDLEASDIGSLHLRSVGSGDATFRNVRGASKIGSIGSGDLKITGSQSPVDIGSVGSGDVDLERIGGNITVGSIGSGDIEVDGARGDLVVHSVGSGDVAHRGVEGTVDLPRGH